MKIKDILIVTGNIISLPIFIILLFITSILAAILSVIDISKVSFPSNAPVLPIILRNFEEMLLLFFIDDRKKGEVGK